MEKIAFPRRQPSQTFKISKMAGKFLIIFFLWEFLAQQSLSGQILNAIATNHQVELSWLCLGHISIE